MHLHLGERSDARALVTRTFSRSPICCRLREWSASFSISASCVARSADRRDRSRVAAVVFVLLTRCRFGLVSTTPRAFTAASPAHVCSLIRSRPEQPIAVITLIVRVFASGMSAQPNRTPLSANSAMNRVEQVSRSSFAITRVVSAVSWQRRIARAPRLSFRSQSR